MTSPKIPGGEYPQRVTIDELVDVIYVWNYIVKNSLYDIQKIKSELIFYLNFHFLMKIPEKNNV